jgi:hypothetical protein
VTANLEARTQRVSLADIPAELRTKLDAVAEGKKVEGHHGYRSGVTLKIVGMLLGFGLAGAALLSAVGLAQSKPIRSSEVPFFIVAAFLGFLLGVPCLRNLNRDLNAPLRRRVFVTPSLVVRVQSDGETVLVDRLANLNEETQGTRVSQADGAISFIAGAEAVRIKGFESMTALNEFVDAMARGVEHVEKRADAAEDGWLDRLDPSRAPALPTFQLKAALVLSLICFLLGAVPVIVLWLVSARSS